MLTKMATLRFVISVAVALSTVQPTTTQALSLPALDPENLPNTNFSCIGKVIGGYYADVYTDCQMFHVCTLDEKGEIHDYKFACILETVFDQETRVCERADEVDCSLSESFFHLNNELYGPGIIPPTAVHRVSEGDTSGTTDFPTTTQTAFVFPETSFSCLDKIPGGLYADVETGCVVFHICSVGPDSSFNDNKFVCGEGTLFDQKSRTCQAAPAVDCSLSESLYYLNDRLKGPEKVVDLCLSQPLGTPLADLTSGCQNYMICESQAGGSIVERHYSCKKGYLFSQMRKRCLSSKKVNCVKETLSGILGLDSSKMGKSKRRMTRSLLQHRLKRAALPPLVNIVTNAGMDEDARVRRALFSLAALHRWATENARDTTFIEVYTLNTKESGYPKKSLGENTRINHYGHLSRKKRNAEISERVEEPVKNINPTSTLPLTITIPPTKTTQDVPVQTLLPKTSLFSQSASVPVSPTKISATLSTLTVTNSPRITFITLPPSTSTVTVTNFVTVGVQATETAVVNTTIVNTAVPTSSQSSIKVSSALPIPTNTAATAVISAGGTNDTEALSNVNGTVANSTPPTQGLSTSRETVELVTDTAPLPVESPAISNNSTSSTTQDQVKDQLPVMPTRVNVTESPVPVTEGSMGIIEDPAPSGTENVTAGNTTSVTASTVSSTTVSSSVNISLSTTAQPPPENITTATPATTPRVETVVTEAVVENKTAVVSMNVTTSLTNTSTTTESSSPASLNVSTTALPSNDISVANNASVTPVPLPTSSTLKPLTRDNLPETNFTCKDKKLGQFYADTEANCQVFHYCSEGFKDAQILDLKFLCTGATMFHVMTGKCENKSMVTCGEVTTELPNVPDTSDQTVNTTEVSISKSPEHPLNTTKVNITQSAEEHPLNTTEVSITQSSEVHQLNTTEVSTTQSPEEHHLNTTEVSITQSSEHPLNTTEANISQSSQHPLNTTEVSISQLSGLPLNTTEASISQSSEHPQTMTNTEVAPATAEIPTVEPNTEVSQVNKSVSSERIVLDEIETSTIESITEMTTEFLTEDYVEVATELGPELSRMEEKIETKLEPLEPVTTASSLPPLTTTPPSQIISLSSPPPALSNATLSSSAVNISSHEVSKNNSTEALL